MFNLSNKTPQDEALRLVDEYRATMPRDVLHLWAADVVEQLRRLHAQVQEQQAELMEQARLLGISAEREMALMARVQELERAVEAEREACAQVCDDERVEFLLRAGDNNGRESDFAFGSVNSAERIAAAIRARGAKGESNEP